MITKNDFGTHSCIERVQFFLMLDISNCVQCLMEVKGILYLIAFKTPANCVTKTRRSEEEIEY